MKDFTFLLNHLELTKVEINKKFIEVKENLGNTSIEEKLFVARNVLPVIGDNLHIKEIPTINLDILETFSKEEDYTVIELLDQAEEYYSDNIKLKNKILDIVLNFFIENKIYKLTQ